MEVIGGRYELGEVIGRGGMARVVRGRDLRLDRDVAIKLVPIDAADGVDRVARERFVREARSSARFHHPHAVAVFDAGQDDRYLFLVMELIGGPSLSAVLAERGPLGVDEAVRITSEVLEALGAAHGAGIVHRDVKPANVLMTSSGEVKLADFGIAKRLDEVSGDLTSTGQFIGTPKYLAPEQVMGGPVTGAADLYSTGVLLFEMLAGSAPFDATTPVATAIAHRDEPVPDLGARRTDAPRHVVDAVSRAMAKQPGDRFESADEMRAALAGTPAVITAPPAATAVAPAPGAVLAPTMVIASTPAAAVESTPTRSAGRSDSARRAWWFALFVLAAIAAAAVAIAADRDDAGVGGRVGPSTGLGSVAPTQQGTTPLTDPPPATDAQTAPPPTVVVTAPPTTIPPTAPPTTEPPAPEPTSLEQVIGIVGVAPESLGESGPEFVDDLDEVLERDGRDQAQAAEKLLDDIDKWVDDGELQPGAANLARPFLESIAAQETGNGGDGNDGGGNEGDEDD